MEMYHFEQIVLDWPISVELKRYGLDWMVQITGGCAPHIGSVSVGTFADGEVHLRKILLPSHRDDVIGDRFAETLTKQLRTTVSVVCGIHYDMPGKEGLRQIVDCTERLLQEIQHRLVAAQSD